MKISFYNERSWPSGDWGDWKTYEVLEESKEFLRVRKWFFFSHWIPKQGLGMKLMYIHER